MARLIRPGIVFVLVIVGLAAGPCGGDDRPATPGSPTAGAEVSASATPASSTATASVTTTPGASATATTAAGAAETNSADGVKAFARAIDEALGRGDVGAVTSRVRGTPEVAFSHWMAAPSTLPVDRVRTDLTQLLTRTRAPDRDSYGMAAPKVWWVGYDMSRPNLVVTDISLDEATGYRRLGVLLQLRYCESGCATEDQQRWVISGVVLDWGDRLLSVGNEFVAAFGRQGERYRRPLVLTPEIREAAQRVAGDFGEGVRAIPDCAPSVACITTVDAGDAVDLGVMRLGYQEAAGGGALVFAGRMADRSWRYWFGTQNVHYQMVDLPGDILVCADGDGLNARERPEQTSPVVGFVADLTKLRAEEFVLTEPGSTKPDLTAGAGWYRVNVGSPARTAWVHSRFTTDARLKDCAVRNGFEATR